MSRCLALVPAAGGGSRMGADRPKQYLDLAGAPLLAHTLRRLLAEPRLARVLVVLAPDDVWFDRFDWPRDVRLEILRVGGATRAESVRNGLLHAGAAADDWVLVHDAARCCLPPDALDRLIDTLQADPVGGLLALPVADTLKRETSGQRVAQTVSREGLWLAQTPQMFRAGMLALALDRPLDRAVTDEASAIERLGLVPRLVTGDALNFKVTWPHDLVLARAVLGLDNAGK
ncbi:2-C-methyl-D-erythritol 4-phosphate cytidylyltransferase [Laribacter hongkongensis]|jgi:2-C-methyl-D-erythritol 4-phosphate cytidylyltransferase|uniref:2-C-methyl-D-erythritol 4-phosphate cytidylyltransferase n=2 Tax=Laribacter hongkongensis TaxID=168471 RepID=ISPD_LARHH|nr:2-C-methyl-D-erythritol 4-phosphate cytidylyltransferase [Laribacter hongkongensis]C1D558.1 RecName: Full=2-C-methyl-D-erythritol 4-phosphate cytidylyltransferase; AltName: Full=4-diphosphocytidyl-2C-methyl-D-erythritol synthase; AltName: Full=MEP cytidylyltransferase; Short=MCT [Laribacter hongkongensis HLHK9]ACO73875.1 IspD [Laribacter hongkongensis HLHK9]MBE5528756.1 2-C-methyl-D-erythritol 4-phosphate cytidylyltransferase [Laribacter hongkongensis]MCG8993647.1 2-C-methyl-D-erythritol 4-p